MFDDYFHAATNVDHQVHEAPTSNLQLFHKVLMMTILILKLHMNNDPSSGVPFSKPDFEDSHLILHGLLFLPKCTPEINHKVLKENVG